MAVADWIRSTRHPTIRMKCEKETNGKGCKYLRFLPAISSIQVCLADIIQSDFSIDKETDKMMVITYLPFIFHDYHYYIAAQHSILPFINSNFVVVLFSSFFSQTELTLQWMGESDWIQNWKRKYSATTEKLFLFVKQTAKSSAEIKRKTNKIIYIHMYTSILVYISRLGGLCAERWRRMSNKTKKGKNSCVNIVNKSRFRWDARCTGKHKKRPITNRRIRKGEPESPTLWKCRKKRRIVKLVVHARIRYTHFCTKGTTSEER